MHEKPVIKCLRMPVLRPLLLRLIESAQVILFPFDCVLMSSLMTLAFHALLRIGKCCQLPQTLHLSDVNFLVNQDTSQNKFITISFGTTKTDQLGLQNQWTWILKSKETDCPVTHLLSYLKLRPSSQCHNLFLNSRGNPMTKSQFASKFMKLLRSTGQQTDSFKSHSLRIGGATYLFLQGWSINDIKDKGRWVSDTTARLYCGL